jgi:hypothetical protein
MGAGVTLRDLLEDMCLFSSSEISNIQVNFSAHLKGHDCVLYHSHSQ